MLLGRFYSYEYKFPLVYLWNLSIYLGLRCRLTKEGREFAGHVSVTQSGLMCQRWDSDRPHAHRFKTSTLFPEGSAEGAGNNCRNPDNSNGGPWCYTTDPNRRWDYCNVEFCGTQLDQSVNKTINTIQYN